MSLEVEHEVGVAADELADLVHHEEQAELAAVGLGLGVGVVADLVGEGLERDVLPVGVRHPALRLGAAHHARLLEGLHEVVGEEVVLGAGVKPGLAVDVLEGGAEVRREALLVYEALEAGQAQVLAVEAQVVVEDAGEGALEHTRVLGAHGLVVHVEEDGLGGHQGAAAGAGGGHLVGELAVEVVDGGAPLHDLIGEQIGEHLEEVRLARAEEARDPDADLVGGNVEGGVVGVEERGEVAGELVCDHVLGKLLAHGLLVGLGHLHDAVDVAVNVALKHLLDEHGLLPLSWLAGRAG